MLKKDETIQDEAKALNAHKTQIVSEPCDTMTSYQSPGFLCLSVKHF